jgi:hypothetical protein
MRIQATCIETNREILNKRTKKHGISTRTSFEIIPASYEGIEPCSEEPAHYSIKILPTTTTVSNISCKPQQKISKHMLLDVMETAVLSDQLEYDAYPLSSYQKPHGKERIRACTNPD